MAEQKTNKDLTKKISPIRIFLPVVIGLGAVAYMLYTELDLNALKQLHFDYITVILLFVSLLFMGLRDLGYMLRLYILSEGKFRWKQLFRIIMLWEFSSAVTPSAIGGTGLAVLFINKEGIPLGRSTAIVMATSFLDEVYFILMFPLLLLFLNHETLFFIPHAESGTAWVAQNILYMCLVGYGLKLLWVLMLTYGLFFNPRGMKYFLLKVFKLPILRRFRRSMGRVGTDMVNSSYRLRTKSWKFWMKSFLVTFLSWTSRYWIVNVLIVAFFATQLGWGEHFIVFGRQLIMWIIMLISPTPGGSGLAELVFKEFLAEFIPGVGVAVGLAFLWRIITYYPYLIIGAFIVPKWVKRNFSRENEE